MDRAVVSAALTNLGVLICGLLFLFAGMAVLLWAGLRAWDATVEVVAFWRYRWTEKKAER